MTLFRKFRRWMINLLVIGLVIFILFLIAGFFITRNYGEEIKQYAIKQINEQLETKVSVKKIDFSFLSKFPYLSVIFDDVSAYSSGNFNQHQFINNAVDTLFSADKIYLQFNIFEIVMGKYHLRRIHASGGNLNMLVDEEGKVNYILLKRSGKGGKSKDIELEAVKLENFSVSFINLAKELKVTAHVRDILFKGKFSKGNYDMASLASFRLLDVTRQGVQYAGNTEVSLRVIVNIADQMATIRKGEVDYNNLRLNVSGSFGLANVSDLDISLQGRNFNLRSLIRSLPRYQQEKLGFDIYGKGDIAVKIKGKLSRIDVPSVKAVYLLNINRLVYENRDFQNIRLKGNYSNGKLHNPLSTSINIDNYFIKDYQSNLTGSLNIHNLKQPYLKIIMKGVFDASAINEFYKDQNLRDFKGYLQPDLNISFQLKSFNDFNLEKILTGDLKGNVKMDNFEFITGKDLPVSSINGIVSFSGDTWFPVLEFYAGKSHLKTSLEIDNVLPYISGKDASLWISGSAESEFIDLSPFLSNNKEDEKSEAVNFPDNLHMRINLDINHLKAKDFSASAIKTYLRYKPRMFSFSPLTMNTMEGKLTGKAAVIQDSDKNYKIEINSDFQDFNINHLFKSFNNFGQDFITASNLRGLLTGNIELSASFDSMMAVNKKELISNAEIFINSGELIDFDPVKKLSRFIELEELSHIYFSKLENNIMIRDGQIAIPKMEINSSAFNLSLSGIHGFDNHYNYKVKVNLSEILARKAGSVKRENLEFGVIEPDNRRTSLFLSINGTPENIDIKYDKKEAVNQIRQDLRDEKTNLKTILNEEFGWFRKDTAELKVNTKDKKLIIDWDEENSGDKQTGKRKKRSKQAKEEEEIRFEWDDL